MSLTLPGTFNRLLPAPFLTTNTALTMDGKRLVACLFAPLLFAASAMASTEKDMLLDMVYDQAGLERQLDWVHDSMTLPAQGQTIPEPVVDTVNQVVKVRYSADFFRTSMKSTLDEALTMGELAQLIDWFESPLGQKILGLEAEANKPENRSQMTAYIEDQLPVTSMRQERVKLIEELMATLDTVELSTELTANAALGAQRMLREVMPVKQQSRQLEVGERFQIQQQMKGTMRDILLYTYRSLPDDEIQQYLDFARKSAMQNFQRGQIQALSRIF